MKVAVQKRSKKSDAASAKNQKQKLEPNPIDSNYDSLHCDMKTLPSDDKEYKLI
jgi:hypothetical protein